VPTQPPRVSAALVKTQVESQIKVRDFSRASVSISPAEFASWSDARAELLLEAKRPLKCALETEISEAHNDTEIDEIRAAHRQREREIEHELDHIPREVHISLSAAYNVSRPARPTRPPAAHERISAANSFSRNDIVARNEPNVSMGVFRCLSLYSY
jgi:hypothetical protein